MAFDVKGFRTHDFMFNPSGAAGANLSKHSYVSNDDVAAIETAGYFDTIYGRLKKGDHIDMVLDLDATPIRRAYIVTASASTGVTIAAQNVL